MKLTRSICSSDIRKINVLDSSGETVGKVTDLTFTFDGELKLSKFILAGSRWEEFLESIKVRQDRDPVFDGSLIRQIDDHIHLEATVDSLKTTLDEDAIPKGDIRLTQIEKMDIVDNTDKKVGRAIAVNFELDGSVSIIVGGGFIEEKLEAAGLKTDIDIIVPGHVISAIGDKIHLNVSEESLA
ncbi:MAG: PRC-barrel domain-containing protein, partial [Candidatus Thorarchaeota archaeon]|nr:PRC-barrel domain-containing protein [Candidatus Thorarchaeota archaeon]